MKPKTLAILAAVALALVALAAFSIKSRSGAHAQGGDKETLLPDLAERVNDVAEVQIEKAEQKTTLAKEGDTWVCREESGYRADFDKVRSLLVALARLEVVEPMTKDPAGHGKLGVDAASGAHVVLRDNEGRAAADDLREAAEVAAFFSDARGDTAVDVHVARRKHLRPGRGGPGRVQIGHSETLRIAPRDPEGRLRRR